MLYSVHKSHYSRKIRTMVHVIQWSLEPSSEYKVRGTFLYFMVMVLEVSADWLPNVLYHEICPVNTW